MSASPIRSWALALIAWATAGAAHADEWRVCFQPGTEILTPEGYAAAREAAARLEIERSATPRHPASLQVQAPGGPEATDRAGRLAREVRLEMYRLGVGVIFVAQAQGPVLNADCVRLALDPRGAPTLWHSVGPYFTPGSAEVTAEWRERLRETTAQYRPGDRFCVQGFADRRGSDAANQALAQRRAESTAREMARQGVRWEDIALQSWGEARLARPTADGVADPLNRRVFIDTGRCPAGR